MEKAEENLVPRAGIEPATLRFSVAHQGEENQRDEAENAAKRPIDNATELERVQNTLAALAAAQEPLGNDIERIWDANASELHEG